MLGSKEQRTEGIRRQAQELIDQAYERGFKAGKESEAIVIQDAQYRRGLDDAWECARKILNAVVPYDYWYMGSGNHISHAIKCYSASEAIAKIKAYEEQKKAEEERKIMVGDEVIIDEVKVCVLEVCGNEVWFINDLGVIAKIKKDRISGKTGRTFPQIAEVLNQLQEGE